MKYVLVPIEQLEAMQKDLRMMLKDNIVAHQPSVIFLWSCAAFAVIGVIYFILTVFPFEKKRLGYQADESQRPKFPDVSSGHLLPGKSIFIPVSDQRQNANDFKGVEP